MDVKVIHALISKSNIWLGNFVYISSKQTEKSKDTLISTSSESVPYCHPDIDGVN